MSYVRSSVKNTAIVVKNPVALPEKKRASFKTLKSGRPSILESSVTEPAAMNKKNLRIPAALNGKEMSLKRSTAVSSSSSAPSLILQDAARPSEYSLDKIESKAAEVKNKQAAKPAMPTRAVNTNIDVNIAAVNTAVNTAAVNARVDIAHTCNPKRSLREPVYEGFCCEAKVIAQAIDGCRHAQGELYNVHHARVRALCLKVLKNYERAEDIAHEIFIHMYKKLSGFRGDALLSTWLHRSTINHCLMEFRKNDHKMWANIESLDRDPATEDDENATSAAKLQLSNALLGEDERSIDAMMLNKCINSLSYGYRTVLILNTVYGYTHEEIAGILGCSVGTSKSQLHKAKGKVITMMGKGLKQYGISYRNIRHGKSRRGKNRRRRKIDDKKIDDKKAVSGK